jgi:hypothetical protein
MVRLRDRDIEAIARKIAADIGSAPATGATAGPPDARRAPNGRKAPRN